MTETEELITQRFNEAGVTAMEAEISDSNFELRAILGFIGRSTKGTLLDVGSGKGRFSGKLKQHGFQVTGVEPAGELLRIARERYPGINFIQASATHLPFPEASFDCLICVEVLEHIPDTSRAILEMARVLKPGGKLVIIDKNIRSLHHINFLPTALWKFWMERTGRWMYPSQFPFREKYFVPQDLNRLIQSQVGESRIHYLKFTPDDKHRPPLKQLLWIVHQMISTALYRLWPGLSFYVAWEAVKPSSRSIPETRAIDANLTAGVDWLLKGLRASGDTGFPATYRWVSGWAAPYPETTGYIIPTLLNCTDHSGYRSVDIQTAIQKAGEWLLSIQLADGSFPGYGTTDPIIFDTGQIIFGLVALYRHTGADKYLVSAKRAADWLVTQQESNGSWIKYAYNGIPHAYHARVAWALLVLHQVDPLNDYHLAAIKNLDWVVAQQQANGWFNHVSFDQLERASLHTIAYTIQGLLESGLILNDQMYIQRAKLSADQLLSLFQAEQLHSFYNSNWQPLSRSDCLTGLAQVAWVWLRLFDHTQKSQYHDEAAKVISYLRSQQVLSHYNPNLPGALAGSRPFWGAYMPRAYPNWSVKFFIDALMLIDDNHQAATRPYQG